MTQPLHSNIVGVFADMTIEERLVYLYLVGRHEADPKVGLTQQELSRQTGLSLHKVRETLKILEEKLFISVRPTSKKRHNIFLLEPHHSEVKIPFTYEDTDDRRIHILEQEVLRLSQGNKEQRRLSTLLQGERAAVVGEIEAYTGGLTLVEAYMLGQVISLLGPERLKAAWRKNAHAMKDPVRGVSSMLLNKAYGSGFKPKEDKTEVTYRKFRREDG